MTATATKLYVQMVKVGYIDAGEWHKPRWELRYGKGRYLPLKCSGPDKPLGQDVIDAIRTHGDKAMRAMTDGQILDAIVLADRLGK